MLVALCAGVGVTPLTGQTAPALPAPTVPFVLILPGDSAVRGRRIVAASVQYALIAYPGEQQQRLGTAVDVVRLDMRGESPGISRVLTVSQGRAPPLQSAEQDAPTPRTRSTATVLRDTPGLVTLAR